MRRRSTTPLREDARRAPLVGLVRPLPECTSERQQSEGGGRRRRPLHAGGPSSMTPFEESVLDSSASLLDKTVLPLVHPGLSS